jgi:bud site selection protein 31
MPKIKTLNSKKPPKGWDIIEPTLLELYNRMREAENDPSEGKRKPESLWPIIRINHQMSRYVYELFKVKKQIAKGKLKK